MLGEAQKTCCSTGRSQTAPGGLLKRLSVDSKSAAHSAPWCMCVQLIQWGIVGPHSQVMLWATWEDPASQGTRECFPLCVMCLQLGENLNSFPFRSFNKYLLISYCVHITLHQAVKGGRLVDEWGFWVIVGSDEAWGMVRKDDVYNSNPAVCPVSSTVPGTKQILKKYLLNQFEVEIFWVINFIIPKQTPFHLVKYLSSILL